MRGIALMVLAGTLNTVPAFSDSWCLPYNECMGEPTPIRGNSFDTCEESCTMRDPVPVRGLDANLYDVKCEGDSSRSEYRMLLGEYTDWDGDRKAYIVTPHGTEQLERCPI